MPLNAICPFFNVPSMIAMVCLGSIAYGIHIVVAAMTIFFAGRAKNVEHLRRYRYLIIALLGFSSVNYFLSIASHIYDQNSEDSSPYDTSNVWWSLVVLPEMMAVVVSALCNGLLMYRCYIVWNKRKSILIIPGILFSSSVVGAMTTIFCRTFGSIDMLLVFWPLFLVLNLTLSALISGRIIFFRRRLRRLVGKDLNRQLIGTCTIATLVVESSILYTIVSVVGVPIITFRWMPYVFSPVLVHTECIASELIILRVILGQAITSQWASETTNFCSTAKNQTFRAETTLPPYRINSAQNFPIDA